MNAGRWELERMARRKIVAGNWKMNMTPSEAVKLVEELKDLVKSDDVDVVYCVPAIDIVPVVEAVKGTNVEVGAENMYIEEKGAYTGEIAPGMLVDAGVKYVIIGHSERREYFAETDETVNKKVLKAFEHKITPIICCGESLVQREQGITIDWIRQQIKIAFLNVTAEQAKTAVIAYEPIWAIGTGKVATTEQAEEVCAAIRVCIGEIYDAATAAALCPSGWHLPTAEELTALIGADTGSGFYAEAGFWQSSLNNHSQKSYLLGTAAADSESHVLLFTADGGAQQVKTLSSTYGFSVRYVRDR